jgi:hypothetical protein
VNKSLLRYLFSHSLASKEGTSGRQCSWVSHYATSRKVANSILDKVTEFIFLSIYLILRDAFNWYRGLFLRGVRRQQREADNSLPTGAEDKNMWICTSTLPYAFMVYCLVKHRDNYQRYFLPFVFLFAVKFPRSKYPSKCRVFSSSRKNFERAHEIVGRCHNLGKRNFEGVVTFS